jgi:hypothetical protein
VKKRILFYSLLGVLAFAVFFRLFAIISENRQAHGLILSKKSFQWNAAPNNSRITDKIKLTNDTKRTIVIKSIKTSCTCTTTENEIPIYLQPSASREISFAINTGNTGRDVASIDFSWCYEGEKETYTSEVNLEANTTSYISTTDTLIDWGAITNKALMKKVVRLNKLENVVVKEVISKNNLTKCEIDISSKINQNEAVLIISLTAETLDLIPTGIFTDELTINYESNQTTGQCRLLVKGYNLTHDINFNPKTLYIGAIKNGDCFEKNIILKVRDKQGWRYHSFEVNAPDNWNITASHNGASISLLCRYRATKVKGNISDVLTINLRNANEKEIKIRIPYLGIIKD